MTTLDTRQGETVSGLAVQETPTAITLRTTTGETVVPKADIAQRLTSEKSLMPEGLEKTITPQQMADLLSFIKNWRYLDGRTPLGKSS